MGYRKPAKVYKIEYAEGHELAGLVVRVRGVSLGQFMRLSELVELDEAETSKQIEQVTELCENFATAIVSWNLEDEDGNEVPATLEGVKSQEFDFVFQLIMRWMGAMGEISAPLPVSSDSGEISQVPMTIPQEVA